MVSPNKPASRKNVDQIVAAIGAVLPFKINTMKGLHFPSSEAVPVGMLSAGHVQALRCAGGGDTPIYVVFSYGTPIAWRCAGDGQEWCAPKVTYSVTTSKHQALAAQGIAVWNDKRARERRVIYRDMPPVS